VAQQKYSLNPVTSSALGNAPQSSVSHQNRDPGSFEDTVQTPQVLVPSGLSRALAEQETSDQRQHWRFTFNGLEQKKIQRDSRNLLWGKCMRLCFYTEGNQIT